MQKIIQVCFEASTHWLVNDNYMFQIFQKQEQVQEAVVELLTVMANALQLLQDVEQFVTLPHLKSTMERIQRTMRQAVKFSESWQTYRQSRGMCNAIFLPSSPCDDSHSQTFFVHCQTKTRTKF